ncbi:hypothetical protein PTI98_004905 [Pleurotus ostreatus]|nr:hypothetical protein PTI98_004905 [Pleurotus ostreatus]
MAKKPATDHGTTTTEIETGTGKETETETEMGDEIEIETATEMIGTGMTEEETTATIDAMTDAMTVVVPGPETVDRALLPSHLQPKKSR